MQSIQRMVERAIEDPVLFHELPTHKCKSKGKQRGGIARPVQPPFPQGDGVEREDRRARDQDHPAPAVEGEQVQLDDRMHTSRSAATTDREHLGPPTPGRALTRGGRAFEQGFMARANRGYLYFDEVNLLEDHFVDLLLDVAQSCENVVEREGLSIRHPARFVLVGSGNPEEGELRPQLLDRFGLSVEVTSPRDIETRVEVMRRRDAYENDNAAFMKKWRAKDSALRKAILAARAALPGLTTPGAVLHDCAALCIALGSDGLRGELTLLRAARAQAAFEGAPTVTRQHLKTVATSALSHRLRRDPLDEAGSGARVARSLAETLP